MKELHKRPIEERQSDDQFSIIVATPDFLPADPPPIQFSNGIDFPDISDTPPYLESRHINHRLDTPRSTRVVSENILFVGPLARIHIPKNDEQVEAMRFAASTVGELSAGTALALAILFSKEKTFNPRRFVAKGVLGLCNI